MSKDFRTLIQESVKQKQLHPEDIPSLDLYMDQVIALMSEHLGEEGEKEPLTRTMIHNYSKAGVISQIKGKKYSREQILQMLAVYSLKNLLSISQIKRILNGVEQSGAGERGLENCFQTQLERRTNINAQLMDSIDAIIHDNDMKLGTPAAAMSVLLTIADLNNTLTSLASAITRECFPELPTKKRNDENAIFSLPHSREKIFFMNFL